MICYVNVTHEFMSRRKMLNASCPKIDSSGVAYIISFHELHVLLTFPR